MPEYQLLRKKYSLSSLFHRPQLAALVTKLPLDVFDLDAAIVFSDILVIVEALGCSLRFPKIGGPKIIPKISWEDPVETIEVLDVRRALSYVYETIRLLKKTLTVPLIGFCGGPFTVATYLILEEISLWLSLAPGPLHLLLEKITQATELYLEEQINSGVDVIQIFDSWANLLNQEQRALFCYPYIRRLVQVAKKRNIPVIFFCRGSSLFPEELVSLGVDAISFDGQAPLHSLREKIPHPMAVQGNLSPDILAKSTPLEVEAATAALLCSMHGKPGWIANLGHGILPSTPVDNVHAFIRVLRG